MKLVVTDACIFIDIIELQLTAGFFALQQEVHTTSIVIHELYREQQQELSAYQQSGKLIVHSLSAAQQQAIADDNNPRGLSPEDCSILVIAQTLGAVLLSSDKVARTNVKNLAIEYHGMFWIFDRLVEEKVITPPTALASLNAMMQANIIYKGNKYMMAEAEKRYKRWSQ